MSSPLKQNTTIIQELLNTVNSLPEAGGVELPTLSNEGSASDLLLNKQLIGQNGNVVTGSIQDFDGSYECSGDSTGGSGDSGGGNLNTCTILVSAESPNSGGGYIAVTQWVDGNIVPSVYGWYPNTSSTIENVVCGSVITAREIVDCIGNADLSDNMTILEYDGVEVFDPDIFMAIAAPTEPNAVGEIRFWW